MGKVLAIAAHPDDESVFAGGMLAKLVEEGSELYLLMTTRGEGGEVGDPPVCDKSVLGEYRERELRCAASALGAREVFFLDYIDPAIEIGEDPMPIAAGLEEFAGAVAAVIDRIRPDTIVTHGSGGEYGHPQHVYTLRAVREALRRLDPWYPKEFLTWCANGGANAEDRLTNKDDPADIVLDVTPWLDRKVAAMECHVTQHALFKRNNNVEQIREMVRRVEAFRRWPRELLLAAELKESEVETSHDWGSAGS